MRYYDSHNSQDEVEDKSDQRAEIEAKTKAFLKSGGTIKNPVIRNDTEVITFQEILKKYEIHGSVLRKLMRTQAFVPSVSGNFEYGTRDSVHLTPNYKFLEKDVAKFFGSESGKRKVKSAKDAFKRSKSTAKTKEKASERP